MHKGDKLYVDGRLRYRSYDDQRGQRRFVTEIIVENMEMLTPKPATQQNEGMPAGQPQAMNQAMPNVQPQATTDDSEMPF